jgi:polysaccharide export outer membrane protein
MGAPGFAVTISLVIAAILVSTLMVGGTVSPQGTQALPVNDYKIGAKDLLDIAVFELPELNQTVRVSEDGSITLSLLGKVDVGGLTAQDLEKKLTTLLDQQYTTGAHVTVFIREYQKVSIIGAVGQPGQYQLIGPTTLLQAIAQAGGLTAQAMDEIIIYRQGDDGRSERIIIKRDDLLTGGGQDVNIMLRPKDVVTIAVDQTLNVFVYGEVKTPGAIPYLSSKKITLVQAIAQAGGPTEWAKLSRIVIKRKDRKTGKEMQIRVNLKKMISGKVADITLEEGDVVIVP